MPVALGGSETLNVLAAWAACGVGLVRDTDGLSNSAASAELLRKSATKRTMSADVQLGENLRRVAAANAP